MNTKDEGLEAPSPQLAPEAASAQDDRFLALCTRIPGDELAAAECENLTGSIPEEDGVAFCQSLEYIARGAYVHTGLRLIAQAETFEDLLQAVNGQSFPAEGFRIDHLRLASRKLVNSQKAVLRLADNIPAYPDLKSPKHRFLLIERDSGLLFGEILAESAQSYRQHDRKPFRTSTSLPSRLSRALINLVSPPARTILDPCCGTGSILLEAQALGLQACGVDWNEHMVEMSRQNLAHFGYQAQVIASDFREVTSSADAIVTDLPYGMFMREAKEDLQEIIRHAHAMAPQAVFILGEDISAWLRDAGYSRIKVFRIPKRKDFSRFVHWGQR